MVALIGLSMHNMELPQSTSGLRRQDVHAEELGFCDFSSLSSVKENRRQLRNSAAACIDDHFLMAVQWPAIICGTFLAR